MKLTRTIKFWVALCPIILRYGFGQWYAFKNAPDWLVDMAAQRAGPVSNDGSESLWNEAAKERNSRMHQQRR